MLSHNPTIKLLYDGGQEQREFLADVRFTQKIEGDLYQLLNWSMKEYHYDRRIIIEVHIQNLTTEEAYWIADFIWATDKQLWIDGEIIDVVNHEDNYELEIDYWKKTSWRGEVTFKLIKKQTGVKVGILETHAGELITTHDGDVIHLQ